MNSTKTHNTTKANSSRNSVTVSSTYLQNYSTTTIIYVILFLVLALGIVYLWNFYKTFKSQLLPSQAMLKADCPDYWESIGDGKCQNVNVLGSCANQPGTNIVDFSGDIFTNSNTGDYAKCKWATACSMSWTGIDRVC